MGVTARELNRLHPQLFHMAEEGTWNSIRDNGLLSTAALLDRYGINGEERRIIEETNRRKRVVLDDRKLGAAVIRDQFPLTDGALSKCLTGMSNSEWYRLLNSQVYFWTSMERLMRLFNAKAYRGNTNSIITIDTKKFLSKYANKVSLSPINSGSTIFNPQPRGGDTFLSLSDFPFDYWRTKRGSPTKAVVEVTVKYSVPDIRDFVVGVVHMRDKEVTENIV